MKFYQKLDGAAHVSAREYDVAASTAITEGQFVKLSGGKVVSAVAAETGALLGVAAENHSGSADALDPRANGTKLLVIDDPSAVFQCAAPQITASGGSATTLEFTAGQYFANDDFNGGYVKLVSKAADSTNTDEIGTVREITDFAVTASTKGTFTLASGGSPNAGDVYEVYPPVGFAKGNLNAAKDGVVLSASASLPTRVIGADVGFGKINVQIKKHIFAVDA
ncbi:MAG: hypothetical protein IJT71_01010 [Oscillospiraceae bacterium]|nr:hypothetical protein [Oscillospiraceae bacterium]